MVVVTLIYTFVRIHTVIHTPQKISVTVGLIKSNYKISEVLITREGIIGNLRLGLNLKE